MIALTEAMLHEIMPRCDAAAYIPYLNPALVEFEINTPARAAMFLAQVAHESSELTQTSENLNYSIAGLMKVWPSRFQSVEMANKYAHQPEKIANFVYANRNGNGDESSGDGWAFRGAGALQLTGRSNQLACANWTGVPPESISEWLRGTQGAITSAGWFWMTNDCNHQADIGDFEALTRKINGGLTGFNSRLEYFNTAQIALV